MGKRYYAGVPGMHEQFGPVLKTAASRSFDSTRRHREQPNLTVIFTAFVMGIPAMPIWASLMLVKESFHMFFRTFPNTPERKQALFNMKFAAFFLVVGMIMWSVAMDIVGL